MGLGNPGDKYAHTRHNLGFMILDNLAQRLGVRVDTPSSFSLVGRTSYQGGELILAKPQTYMNDSGRAVKALIEEFGAAPDEVLIICDDVELDPGRLRIRRRGGHGGHNGLRSIIQYIGVEDFPRIRVGVGKAPQGEDLVEHVLGGFTHDERRIILEVVDLVSDAVETILSQDIEAAMNTFNSLCIAI